MSISYVICTCQANFTSHNGFRWPALGEVVFPDFEATDDRCGSGLYGFLNGCGSRYGYVISWESDDQWLLVAVPSDTIIDLGSYVKFPAGEVVFSSQDRLAVIAELERRNPETKLMPIIGAARVSMLECASILTGYRGSSTSGDKGQSTSGDQGISISGARGTSITGDSGKSMSGYGGTSTSGCGGSSTSGEYGSSNSGGHGKSTSSHYGKAISGDHGTSISGYGGQSISGRGGTSISEDRGYSTSGDYGTSIVGFRGEAQSGLNGNLIFFCIENGGITKPKSFFVDGVNVKANTFYRCEEGKLIEVNKAVEK